MTDAELIARLLGWARDIQTGSTAIWAMDQDLKAAADRIEALTEQLIAAHQDAKEAEAYAEELEKDLNTCRMAQAVMDNTVAGLEGKLAKAVGALRFYAWENEMRLPSDGPWGAGSTDFGKVARATLVEIKGESHE
jgi:chromosome segregation ATPase